MGRADISEMSNLLLTPFLSSPSVARVGILRL